MHAWHDVLHDLHLGACTASEAAARLFGHTDAGLVARLDIYRRGLVGSLSQGLASQYPQCHAFVRQLSGAERWYELSAGFLAEHPRRHSRPIVALAPFADWLHGRDDLPPWLADLARLERAALHADMAPEERDGLLGAGTSVVAIEHDVLAWNEAGRDPRQPPAACSLLVLTWRDPTLAVRQAEIGVLERFVIEALRRGGRASDAELAAIELSTADFAEIVEQLAELGVTARA